MSLPFGWESRNNTMSEKDLKLGGAAANRFARKTPLMPGETDQTSSTAGAYQGDASGVYKSSDDVRAFYYQKDAMVTNSSSKDGGGNAKNTTTTPPLWADRQRERELQSQQMGVFARHSSSMPTSSSLPASKLPESKDPKPAPTTTNSQEVTADAGAPGSSESALVRVATVSLEIMAATLERSKMTESSRPKVSLQDKEAFAAAIRKAMAVMASY